MKPILTNEDIKEIFGAISVAEGEIGFEYNELKDKLYKMAPKVKTEHDEVEQLWEDAKQNQTVAREKVVYKVWLGLNLSKPLLPQLKKWISDKDNYEILRKHYSDEVCFSADPFRLFIVIPSRYSCHYSSLLITSVLILHNCIFFDFGSTNRLNSIYFISFFSFAFISINISEKSSMYPSVSLNCNNDSSNLITVISLLHIKLYCH